MSSGSKRKWPARPNSDNPHASECGHKRTRSGSPLVSGAPNPRTRYSQSSDPSGPGSRSPSSISLLPETSPSTPALLPNTTPQISRIPSSVGSAWTGLEQALRALRVTSKICPSLSSAVDELVSCLPMFEAAAKNRTDHKELAAGLEGMVDQLVRHLGGTTSERIIATITNVAEAIRKEIESIHMQQSRSLAHRMLGASSTEDDLIRRYRRIEQLFRQLQGEASMSTWNTVDELRVEQQLNSLRPSSLARFNSELSTEVSRRGCTKHTRTTILEESMAWSEDPGMAKIYWMNGMAGTGKTTIAYSLCERLDAGKQLAASFFCTRASPECREAKRIVPTIAYQLARRFAPFRYSLCNQLTQDPDIITGQLSDQFDVLLKKPLLAAKDKLSNNLVIVVDALDECSDPHIVELFLNLLFRSVLELPIKFFVTSRPEPAIRNRMMPESERTRSILYLHEIELSLVQADIELYLREELASTAPTDKDITELAEHAGNLFIYAATAVRHIRPVGKAVNSKARLKAILAVSTESSTTLSAIDALYSTILTAAIDDEELKPTEQDQIRLVLWTAVCACEPILIQTLASLSGLEDRDDTVAALQPLRSVLHISDHSELVTTLHASFPDFMFSQARSGTFHCDKVAHSQFLAERCFSIMKNQLRFNICSIQSSFIPNDQIPQLDEQVKKNISDELFYTCRFWVDHLTQPNPFASLHLLHEFLSQQLLFWMEVMSLKGCMAAGLRMLTNLNIWLTQAHMKTSENFYTFELASDARGFVASYTLNPTSAYIPHIYLSALPLSPQSCSVRLQYLPQFKGLISVSGTIFNRFRKASFGTWASASSSRCAAFSPNGDRIVLGDNGGIISIQDAYDGKHLVQPFKAHTDVVTSLGVSSDGTQIVSSSHDKTLSIWSMHDGSPVSGPFKGHSKQVTSVAFSLDAQLIVSGSDDCTVGIWNSHNVAPPTKLLTGHEKGVTSVAFSPNGLRVISGSLDRTIRLWDVSSGITVFVLSGHTGPVNSVQFAPNGSYVVSGSNDRTIRIWNTSDGSLFCQSPKSHTRVITSIAVSPNGSRIASGSADYTIRVWETQNCRVIDGPFEGHAESVKSVGFSGDGGRIISVSERTVRTWNAQGQMSQSGKGSKKGYQAKKISTSPSQAHMAIWDLNKYSRMYVWDLRNLTQLLIPTIGEIQHSQFSPDGTRIHSLHPSRCLYTWDTQTRELLDFSHDSTLSENWGSLACSPDGTRVATYRGNKAELWHVKSNRSVAVYEVNSYFNGVFFSLDGSRFATSEHSLMASNTCNIWDGDSGARVAGPFSVNIHGLSPDGTYLCGDSNGRLQLIHVNTGEVIHMQTDYHPSSVIFSPDGLHVAIQPSPDTIDIFDTRGQKINSINFQHHSLSISCLEYSSDGWLLLSSPASYREGGGFHVWRIHIDHPPYAVNSDGWVLDDQKRPLVWVPKEIRGDFPGCSGVVISNVQDIIQSVDYGGMLVGDDWSRCYIQEPQSVIDVA